MEEKKTNNLAIVALVLMIINIALMWVPSDFINPMYVIIGMVVIAIVQAVVARVAKKQIANNDKEKGMGMAKTCLILGILGAVFFSISLMGLYILDNDEMRNAYICPQATNCVDNNDGTSTCKYSTYDIICNNKTEENNELPKE